jgi:hypothetical protein
MGITLLTWQNKSAPTQGLEHSEGRTWSRNMTKTFMYYADAESFALTEGDRLNAHTIVSKHRLTGLWHVSLFPA